MNLDIAKPHRSEGRPVAFPPEAEQDYEPRHRAEVTEEAVLSEAIVHIKNTRQPYSIPSCAGVVLYRPSAEAQYVAAIDVYDAYGPRIATRAIMGAAGLSTDVPELPVGR